jgi:hypothetical protein
LLTELPFFVVRHHLINGFTGAPDLFDVVHDIRHRKASDSRDHIYSALALAKDGREFQVDYSLSVERECGDAV